MPEQLSEAEILDLVESVIRDNGAKGMQDMGKVMGILKPKAQGKANMGKISELVKSKLS